MVYARVILAVILVLITIGLTGCFSSQPEDIQAFLKPPEVNVTAENYILQPPDEIEVQCSKVPEIHLQQQRIRPDGKISFEALGEIEVAGKTPEELADVLQQKVSELYTLTGDRPIDVRILAYQSKVFYVLGQVLMPGPKIYTGRDSVLSAIADARPNAMAWVERIQVIRPSDDEDIKPKIFEVNFDRMRVHGDTSKNVLLLEGDIIYVPPTILAALALKVEEVIRPITRALTGTYIIERSLEGRSTGYGGGYGGYRGY
ncbi:MAG: polysaccharide biosynthesis/export family protein [Planctomycetota bacterium]